MSRKFAVQLHADQFDKLARPSQPVAAVAELIWNGLDAEAERIEVVIDRTPLGAVISVIVRDWGHGMASHEIDRDFMQLGGSWKKYHQSSKNGLRLIHGRKGEGRFRAFAIGESVEWETTARTPTGELERLIITGQIGVAEFEVSGPVTVTDSPTGTVVRITTPREHTNRLLAESAFSNLLSQFTLFLLRHPQVTIEYDGQRLDPEALIAKQSEIELTDPAITPRHKHPIVRILEWNQYGSKIKPSLLLCGVDGTVLYEDNERLPTLADFPYTAYVLWQGFQEHADTLDLINFGHTEVSPVLEAAREAIKCRVDEVAAERRSQIIEQWKTADVYPLRSEPKTPAEQRGRDLFDLVAVTAAPAVSTDPMQAKLTLRLLREALEESPAALHRVLKEVLELTPEQIEDLDALLKQTTLGDIIRTTKLVTERLDFLVELERMLFDEESRRRLLERRELHKILESRSWIFGEEYAMVVSDKGLTRVLEAHRHLLGVEPTPVEPVRGADGNPLIIDLFLSAVAADLNDKRHLVVELKRPKVVLSMKEVGQIENYALTVIDEAQFKTEALWWDFWLIGDDMDDKVKQKTRQKDRRRGVIIEGENYRVTVRMWAEVLEENRQRMHFYKDYLNHRSLGDEALEATLSKYLNTSLAVKAS